MDTALLVYTTFPDEETALAIGESLVRDRLAACINVLPGMRSVFRWKDGVERGSEVVAILKTRSGLRNDIEAELAARHPYETPVILFLEPGSVPGTLAWLIESTTPPPSDSPSGA